MSETSAPVESDEPYTSRHDKLSVIRRKVDALKLNGAVAAAHAPTVHADEFGRITAGKRRSRFDPDVVDRAFQGVRFVDGDEAPAPSTRRKAPSKKPAAKRKPKAKTAAKKSATKPTKAKGTDYRPQCAASTPEGKQCRNSARDGSKYCASHKGYHPKAADAKSKDTKPRVAKAKDTAPTGRKKAAASKTATKQVRCAAKTADGKRCKNPSRTTSKYCASHKGYRP